METFNEDQELERLKTWWKQNGLALIVGLAVGIVGVLSWQGWQMYTQHQAEQASRLYMEMRAQFELGEAETGLDLAQRLKNEYSGTPYAAQAALAEAAHHVSQGQRDQAISNLQWVMSYADDDELALIARLRQAKLLWDAGQGEDALALLDTDTPKGFVPLYQELRGDILLETGRQAEAREAYREALGADPRPAQADIIQQKLDDLH